ncbi:MAG TPA: rRNA adenine dimethyltransferase family protein, partial [Acidimicrobiales bacterium]|nr:rRNA adenine dimethyltransferase family protein [Acidimicrobiales bacterium]
EVDRHLLPLLRTEVEPLGARVVDADALVADWDRIADPAKGGWSIVANLPYNVAVPLIVRLLETAPQVTTMLVMVQREVGERLAAGPGSRAYGTVSVKVAYWAEARVLGSVSPQVFVPRPRVESVLVRLERRATPGCPPGEAGAPGVAIPVPGPGSPAYDWLFTVVRAGFAQRRKMLRRALDGVVPPDAFDAAGVAPTARAEQLSLDDWCRLASAANEAAVPATEGSGGP